MRPPTQEEVLALKGYVLKSGLGLQIWGDNFPDGPSGGDAGTGTAERQARIARQAAAEDASSQAGGSVPPAAAHREATDPGRTGALAPSTLRPEQAAPQGSMRRHGTIDGRRSQESVR